MCVCGRVSSMCGKFQARGSVLIQTLSGRRKHCVWGKVANENGRVKADPKTCPCTAIHQNSVLRRPFRSFQNLLFTLRSRFEQLKSRSGTLQPGSRAHGGVLLLSDHRASLVLDPPLALWFVSARRYTEYLTPPSCTSHQLVFAMEIHRGQISTSAR